MIIGLSEAAQDISFQPWPSASKLARRRDAGFLRSHVGAADGAGGNTTVNNGAFTLRSKPQNQRGSIDQGWRGCGPISLKSRITLYMQAAQTSPSAGDGQTQYQYTWTTPSGD